MVNMDNPSDVAAEFAAMMLGTTISTEPVSPDSPLGKLQELVHRRNLGDITEEELHAAADRLIRAALEKIPPEHRAV